VDKGKGKDPILATVFLTRGRLVTRSALQSRKLFLKPGLQLISS